MRIFLFFIYIVILVPFFNSAVVAAEQRAQPMLSYPDVKEFADDIIRRHKLDKDVVYDALGKSYFNYHIISLMDRPAERYPWSFYSNRLVTKERIENGKAYMKKHAKELKAAEKEYGVPPQLITAIMGVESSYGEALLRYDAVVALGTLAFEYPRRAKYFRDELEQLFIIAGREKKDPTTYKSSYAGALGMPQFMPGSLVRFGKDGNGDGRVDIINSHADAIMSVANYMKAHGWRQNDKKILDLVKLTKPLPTSAFAPGPCNVDKAKTIRQFRGMGVVFSEKHDDNAKGVLARMDEGDDWIPVVFFPNACAINKYNRSLKYTTAIALLARNIQPY